MFDLSGQILSVDCGCSADTSLQAIGLEMEI